MKKAPILAAGLDTTARESKDSARLDWLFEHGTYTGGGDGGLWRIEFETPLDSECAIEQLDAAIAYTTDPELSESSPKSVSPSVPAVTGGGEDALIKALRDYIDYLHECDSMTSGYLYAHNWNFPASHIERGRKLRETIADAQAAIAATKAKEGPQ